MWMDGWIHLRTNKLSLHTSGYALAYKNEVNPEVS